MVGLREEDYISVSPPTWSEENKRVCLDFEVLYTPLTLPHEAPRQLPLSIPGRTWTLLGQEGEASKPVWMQRGPQN